jgi:ribosomal protein L16/L10AE
VFRFGSNGLISIHNQRFELMYFRGFKKLIIRRCFKNYRRFKRLKYWVFLKPNFILTKKSTNSRMGGGVGSLVRLCTQLKNYYSFIEFSGYSAVWLRGFSRRVKFKYPLKFLAMVK